MHVCEGSVNVFRALILLVILTLNFFILVTSNTINIHQCIMHVGGIYIRTVHVFVCVSALLLEMFYGCNTDTSNSFAFMIRGFETKSFCLELWLIYLWLVRV